ncbi:hypothetical protein B0T19DRAFT_169684 [Cercophora scortea]|uniref:Uncharacterized protein n=1 Tax=Cercophora scortea TaxID=314031 RepID=A0AAE0IM25_9PEZI|nr:hypothetical protein B0T19DRAFT_169684 [Cercophora scortea]
MIPTRRICPSGERKLRLCRITQWKSLCTPTPYPWVSGWTTTLSHFLYSAAYPKSEMFGHCESVAPNAITRRSPGRTCLEPEITKYKRLVDIVSIWIGGPHAFRGQITCWGGLATRQSAIFQGDPCHWLASWTGQAHTALSPMASLSARRWVVDWCRARNLGAEGCDTGQSQSQSCAAATADTVPTLPPPPSLSALPSFPRHGEHRQPIYLPSYPHLSAMMVY